MCGITGFYSAGGKAASDRSRSELHVIARKMGDMLTHRGPDAGDIWQDPDVPLALSHRRLSIIDLSREGAQPKASASNRYMIAYNGEIYNAREINYDSITPPVTTDLN